MKDEGTSLVILKFVRIIDNEKHQIHYHKPDFYTQRADPVINMWQCNAYSICFSLNTCHISLVSRRFMFETCHLFSYIKLFLVFQTVPYCQEPWHFPYRFLKVGVISESLTHYPILTFPCNKNLVEHCFFIATLYLGGKQKLQTESNNLFSHISIGKCWRLLW